MYDRVFFRSKLGRAALLSIAAMLAMNVVVLHDHARAEPALSAAPAEAPGLA
jgi:hypothetical protein